jgi:hypothetical protein
VLVYDVKVLFEYLLLVGVAITVFCAASFINPYYAFGSILLAIPAWMFYQQAKIRWDAVDPQGF